MRVVKSFVREDYEKNKFGKASEEVCADFTKAERLVALNSPAMQIAMRHGNDNSFVCRRKAYYKQRRKRNGRGRAVKYVYLRYADIIKPYDAFNDIRYDYYFKRVHTAYL